MQIILVDHCLETLKSHVESMQDLGHVVGLILKSSTRVQKAEAYAINNFNILPVTKNDLIDPNTALKIIEDNTSSDAPFLIVDHGGYFSHAIDTLIKMPNIANRFLGVVEVTENGHRKFERIIKNSPVPLISIARSEIKELEDKQVGVSICDATNSLMYGVHAALTSVKNVVILGHGKIGASIADCCRNLKLNTTVIEADCLRAQKARKNGHNVIMCDNAEKKHEAFRNAEVIFSATGRQALSKADVPHLRQAVYIATCTSPDDEFNEDFIPELLALSRNNIEERLGCEENYKVTPYELYDGRQVNILNGGKAVNFAIGGTPGYEICQVWAAILFATTKIAMGDIVASKAVQSLTYEEELAIATITQKLLLTEKPISANKTSEIKIRPRSKSLTLTGSASNHFFQSVHKTENDASVLTPK